MLHANAVAPEVFRRAFWRDPSPEDRIPHAERREWISDNDNVRRWQWFLAVERGSVLTTRLRTGNPFNLARIATVLPATALGTPSWFPVVPLSQVSKFSSGPTYR